ncbi:MAG TPA: hypothetical protein VFV66_27315 [Nonomuraea sp.]|nr:hypothetical protein [Nonomuraea sp.]
MNLPILSAPVERTITGVVSAGQAGAEQSFPPPFPVPFAGVEQSFPPPFPVPFAGEGDE